jgi:hypothetical protein
MKKYVIGILMVIMIISNSCLEEEDGYSLNRMWVGFGMIEEINADPPEYKINMDNGDILVPVASEYNRPWYYHDTNDQASRLKTGDRILINYTIIGDDAEEGDEAEKYYIRVNSVMKVLLKDIMDITPENQDSIGNDPITVKEAWISDSLLNFEIKYWGRYEMHYINLVKEPGILTAEDQPIELELRHNDNDDVRDFPYAAYVSFRLDELKTDGLDSVQFRVTCTDYNNENYEFEGVYNYSGIN